jgi:hypothetical protein
MFESLPANSGYIDGNASFHIEQLVELNCRSVKGGIVK